MNRRSFLAGMLAAAAAPAIARSGVLMPVKPPIWTPPAMGLDLGAGDASPLYTGEIGHFEGFRFILQHSNDGATWQENEPLVGRFRYWRVKAPPPVEHLDWVVAHPEPNWLRYDFGRGP